MTTAAPPRLDIVIILRTLQSIARAVTTPKRVLICYDCEVDNTLPAIRDNRAALGDLAVDFVYNRGRVTQGAVLSSFAAGRTACAVMLPANDDYNADIIDAMVARADGGCNIVCASRFMPGGSMVGCRWLKALLVRIGNFTLYHLARLPTPRRH